MIGDGIEIVVMEIRGDKVRLGICYDPSVTVVHRQEVYDAIKRDESQPIVDSPVESEK